MQAFGKPLASGWEKGNLMLKNYFVVAFRNLWRNRSFSFINIFGLAVSLSVCLLVISMLVQNLSFDTFQKNSDRIVRLVQTHKIFDMHIPFATVPLPAGDYISEHSDAIQQRATLVKFQGDARLDDNVFSVNGFYADDSFFDVFSFEKASDAGSLNRPYTVMVSRTTAARLFGAKDPVGQSLLLTGLGEFMVTGIVEDAPTTSHIRFDVIVSLPTLASTRTALTDNWKELGETASIYHYFLLKPGRDPQELLPVVAAMVKEKYPTNEEELNFRFQAFGSIAPSREWMNNEVSRVPDLASAYFLFGIAILIMITAGFNYTNLSIARALTRAREVGLRKVSGASRLQVYGQFIAEAVLLSMLALLMARAFLPLLQEGFLNLLGHGQGISFAKDYRVYVCFLVFTLVVGWAVGTLPASLLSKFQPAQVLKDSSGLRLLGGIGFRKALIIFQFALSVVFLMTANIITNQFRFATNGPMGFNHSDVVSVMTQGEDYKKVMAMAAQHKDAIEVSASSFLPGTNMGASEVIQNPETQLQADVFFISADTNFIPSIGLKLVAGRNIPRGASETTERFIVVNEAFVRQLGYRTPAEALSRTAKVGNGELEIIGVLKDFHYRPLDAAVPIGPAAIRYKPSDFGRVNIRFLATDKTKFVASLEQGWKTLDNGRPFAYAFFDEEIRQSLNGYRIMTGLMKFVSFLTVVIACLGLLGMAIYSNHTRLKEIAVRKVMGASGMQVTVQLSKGFLFSLVAACGVALPVGYWLNKMWLDRLPYHVEISAGMVISAVVLIFGVGIFTIISQTWRAASVNPIVFLKRE